MNCHHLVVDAMEGIWYADDSQITKLTVEEFRCCEADSMEFRARRRSKE